MNRRSFFLAPFALAVPALPRAAPLTPDQIVRAATWPAPERIADSLRNALSAERIMLTPKAPFIENPDGTITMHLPNAYKRRAP